jgi:hypothetical protein
LLGELSRMQMKLNLEEVEYAVISVHYSCLYLYSYAEVQAGAMT